MLVHMAPEEVAGLQALALKHGGTLTINPETGLAEAGFLKNILPMVAGFALGPAGFGLMSSTMAGLTVGGITALTSGSLEKGLMAGLGAYGGSGLGESLMGAGTGAISSAAGAGAPQVAAESIVPQAVPVAATPSAVSATATPNLFGSTTNEVASAYYPTGVVQTVPAVNAAQGVQTVTPTLSPAELAAQTVREQNAAAFMNEQNQQQAVAKALANKTPMDRLGAGYNAVTSSSDAALKFAKQNAMPLGALGIAALSSDDKKVPTPQSPGMIRPYTYARTKVPSAFDRTENDPMSSRERQYFNDQYTALSPYKAPGPEYMAAGGSVGGYIYDPRTGLYTKPSGEGATTILPSGAVVDSGGSSDPNVDPNPAWTALSDKGRAEYFADPKNAFITNLTALGTGAIKGMVPGAFAPIALGYLANMFGGKQVGQNNYAPVEGRGTALNDSIVSGRNQDVQDNDLDAIPGSYTYGGGLMGTLGDQEGDYDGQGGTTGPAMSQASMEAAAAASNVDTDSVANDDSGVEDAARGGLMALANGGLLALAQGGTYNLGDYSDGGRLLRGPGDGVSDSIPAMIGRKQQARLADGEFVIPARIVSELGNGSTEAGARQLYAMMDRVQKARKKTVGKDKVATNSRAAKLLPA